MSRARLLWFLLVPLLVVTGFSGQFCWCGDGANGHGLGSSLTGSRTSSGIQAHCGANEDSREKSSRGCCGKAPAHRGCRCAKLDLPAASVPQKPGAPEHPAETWLVGPFLVSRLELEVVSRPFVPPDGLRSREHSPPLFLQYRCLRC